MKASELLLEIGCEEIPARYLGDLSRELPQRVGDFLQSNRIAYGGVSDSLFTPRRLVVYVSAVAEKQADAVETILGPPKKVAFDSAGQPTQAARSFAEKNQLKPGDLITEVTAKGEYLAFKKHHRGLSTRAVLSKGLSGVILSLDLPRSMFWDRQQGLHFIRPIRWILCVFAGKALKFPMGDIRSADYTYGHRILHPGKITIRSFSQYESALKRAKVILKPEERRRKILQEIEELVLDDDAMLLEDKSLLETHVRLSEYPTVISGVFDPDFLRLPKEILVTVMRDHQKYFSLLDEASKLQPKFLAVIDNATDRKGYIRRSHERVLKARFADAEFFWESDLKIPMADRCAMLERVVFQEKLGAYSDKSKRLEELVQWIVPQVTQVSSAEPLRSAARLCKCDLTTQMVKEFPELQGIVGGLYVRAEGGSPEISEAIYEHYQPQTLESPSPQGLFGALLSLADKVDNLSGSFLTGHRPSGSKDPFGLRRASHGIVKVILEFNFNFEFKDFVATSINLYALSGGAAKEEILDALLAFVRGNAHFVLETLLASKRASREEINSVLATDCWNFCDLMSRIRALNRIRLKKDFDSLATSFKRIKNIIQKSGVSLTEGDRGVSNDLFQQEEERALHSSTQEIKRMITEGPAGARDYDRILESIAAMGPTVDQFFDRVLVNAKEESLRVNRFNLVLNLYQEFMRIADFSELQSTNGIS